MKKKLICLILSIIFILEGASVGVMAAGNSVEDKEIKMLEDSVLVISSESVQNQIQENLTLDREGSQTIRTGNGIIFQIEIQSTGELKGYVVETGQTIYKKIVQVKETYFLEKNNKKILEQMLSVTFTYDKNSVWIETPETDIVHQETSWDKKWNIVEDIGQLYTPTQCIVSGSWILYKKDGIICSNWKYKNNSHVDIICSSQGIISYQTKTK